MKQFNMRKSISAVGMMFLVFAAGFLANRFIFKGGKRVVKEEAVVIEKRIEQVCKLVTVEGHYSEIFTHTDYVRYNLSPLRKKAILKVNAVVSMGYDLDKWEITTNEDNQTVEVREYQSPEVIAKDIDISYYDISEGLFNNFSEAELNEINEKAKEFIMEKAIETDLKQRAEEQVVEAENLIRSLVEGTGWTVKFIVEEALD